MKMVTKTSWAVRQNVPRNANTLKRPPQTSALLIVPQLIKVNTSGGCIFGCFGEFQSKAVDWIALKSSFTLQGKSKPLPWTAASCKNLSFIAFLRTVLEQLRNA